MLALCYPVLVSLALAAPGISRTCYDYCNTKESDQIYVVPLGCDCAVYTDTTIETEEVSMITLDDTGVYFIPAESHVFQGQFSSQPFFISNPGKLIPKTKSRINREFGISQDPLSDPMHSQSAHVEMYEKTETISHTSIREDFGESPLYLDLEIQESADNRRAALQKYALIEDFESTEHALVECLDFQVIHYTRKYGFMNKFKEFWVARNLNKYEHWPDLEIEENIKKWCSEPESIVQQSLREIKQGIPKKVSQYRSAHIIEDNVSEMNRASNATTVAQSSGAENSTTSMYDNDTAPSETHDKIAEEYTSVENATETQHTTYDPIDDWPFNGVTSSPILNQDEIQNSSPPTTIDAEYDTTAHITENTLIIDNPKETIFEVNRSNGLTSTDAENDLDTLGSENVNTYVPNKSESTIFDDVSILDSKTASLHIPTLSLSREESRETTKSSTTTNFNISNAQTLNEFTTLWYDTSSVSVTEVYPDLRNKYEEKDIKIPKIVTKECQDNTILTTIEGFEELPNNDFKTSTSQSKEIEKVYGDNELDITGRLYFVSKNELVPVRFLQTKGGNISLGMDGSTLCDKLVRKTNQKSLLLTVLCDHIENNIHQDK